MRNAYALLLAIVLLTSCNKSDFCQPDQRQAPTGEVAQLEAYLNDNGITATKDGRGFYYIVNKEGSGKNPTICSIVTVNYEGRLTNGNRFDGATGVTFRVENLIAGWRQAIPLMKPGGSMTLFLPPSLAYGEAGSPPSIPPNSILIFDVELVKIK